MEAEAPEKIYILNHTDYSDRRILNAFTEKENNNDIEYIRADSFIKKACDAFCKVCKMPNCRRNDCKLMGFVSDFEGHLHAYMKGE